jgi:hypothetical protein
MEFKGFMGRNNKTAAFMVKMDIRDSSELLSSVYQTTWHHIRKDNNIDFYAAFQKGKASLAALSVSLGPAGVSLMFNINIHNS